MPLPSKKRPRRRCVLCGISELTETIGHGKFFLVPDVDGRGPVCPPDRGCLERQRQLPLFGEPS